MKQSIFENPVLRTKVKSANVGLIEMIFGYFLGPFGVLMMTTVVSTYYMTYYDLLNVSPAFLAMLPLLSVIPMVLSNVLVGVLVGKTRTKAGKARPFLLLAAPFLLLSGILMFLVPNVNETVKCVWIVISFNLFQSVANPVYGTAHYLMVSLSTRNGKQRNLLSVVGNVPAVAANGFIGSILMPLVLGWIDGSTAKWTLVMSAFAIIAFVCCMVEYFFTRERITEETLSWKAEEKKISTKLQFQSVIKEPFWWLIMAFYLVYQASVMFRGGYIFNVFCHEYFANSTLFGKELGPDSVQSILALVSGIPLALGMFIAWPIANKMGKRNFIVAGMVCNIIGGIVCLISPANFWMVLAGQTMMGIGNIPCAYCAMALFADMLDHVEAKCGFRCDGVSMSVYTAVMTAVNGLAIAFFKLFHTTNMAESPVTRFFFLWFQVIAGVVLIVILLFLGVEKYVGEDHKIILERQKASVLAEGGEWIEPEERLRREQEQADREAEENRKAELRARCEKKGVSFEEAERKYQEKLQRKCK